MTRETPWIAFRMMEADFEWDGATMTLTCRSKSLSPAIRSLVRTVILECSGPGIPAAVAVRRAGERLAQHVTGLRFISGED